MKKYFLIVGLEVPCAFILQDNSRFCLQTGIPNDAERVYRMGFPHLGLQEGAEKLFKKDSEAEITRLIRIARRPEDVAILAKAKPEDQKIQDYALERIAKLNQ